MENPASNPPPQSKRWTLIGIVALVALAASMVGNILLWYGKSRAENKVTSLEEESFFQASHYEQVEKDASTCATDLTYLLDPKTQRIEMKGRDAFLTTQLAVYWNKGSGQVKIHPIQIPPPPTGQQFQLWALVEDTHFDLGSFNANQGPGLLVDMNQAPFAQMFAVTLGPMGGTPKPDLDQAVLIGVPLP